MRVEIPIQQEAPEASSQQMSTDSPAKKVDLSSMANLKKALGNNATTKNKTSAALMRAARKKNNAKKENQTEADDTMSINQSGINMSMADEHQEEPKSLLMRKMLQINTPTAPDA